MSISSTKQQNRLSLRASIKERILPPGSSFKLPRFLTNEPASPARYSGTPISPGYSSSRDGVTSPGAREQWYFPPDPPSPKSRKPEKRPSRSRDSAPVMSPYTQNEAFGYFAEQRSGLHSPRIASTPPHHYPFSGHRSIDPIDENQTLKTLVVHDLRNERKILYADMEVRSGLLYDLIQTIPSVWLTTPKIKEAFIPLLREDRSTTQYKSPTPNELRLIEGFLEHLPDVHIIQQKRVPRKRVTGQGPDEFKRNLNLSSDLVDEFDKGNPRTHVIYSTLIVATLLNEISLWITQQLVNSGMTTPSVRDSEMIVQHCIFGGVLLLETHPEEEPQLAFVDLNRNAWMISGGWLLFKVAEGPDGMPFVPEKIFQRRRSGVVRRIGGMCGGLESFE